MNRLAGLLVLATSLSAAPAPAAETGLKLFGHEIAITDDGAEEALTVDGVELVREAIILIEEVAVVGGVRVAVGAASPGGTACDGYLFVLAFRDGQAPRLDGPVGNCFAIKHRFEADRIVVETPARPLSPGDRWVWTTDAGFGPVEKVPHVLESRSGWPVLAEGKTDHPSRFLDFADTAAAIDALAGPDRETAIGLIDGTGNATYDGDLLVGWSCIRHFCNEGGALVIADLPQRRFYLAWKPLGEPITVRPEPAEWTPDARRHLERQAKEWE